MADHFPPGFLFGASTAAYQIEGAVNEDGRGPSIWDKFSHTPGKIEGDDNGDVACDHYHRYPADIALMRELGLNAYRLSTSWSRILPEGRGAVNAKGLEFYERLVDAVMTAGMEPWICLYHWDLPQALEDHGGWQNRDSARWFADYALVVARRLGDRVRHLATFNEPGVAAFNMRNTGSLTSRGLQININGANGRANSYLLDGANMSSYAGVAVSTAADTTLGVDMIREFRVVTNAFSADYGRAMPKFSLNLLVRDMERSVPFYRDVLGATVRYAGLLFEVLAVSDRRILKVKVTYERPEQKNGDAQSADAERKANGKTQDTTDREQSGSGRSGEPS